MSQKTMVCIDCGKKNEESSIFTINGCVKHKNMQNIFTYTMVQY
jgi:hypothetical protein